MNFGESLTFRSGAVGFRVFEAHLYRHETNGLCNRTTEAVNAGKERVGCDVHNLEVLEKVRLQLCRDQPATEEESLWVSRCQWSDCVRHKFIVFSQNVEAGAEMALLSDKAGRPFL